MISLWTPRDRQGAIDTVREVFDEYDFTWDSHDYHADLYDVPTHYLDQGHRFFVAKSADQVIGTIALELFPAIQGDYGTLVELDHQSRIAGSDCSLERLYVRPSGRKAGVGSQLMETVLKEARANNRKCLEIWSDKRFASAHALYQKFGARMMGERICDDPDESPEWGLIINL